MSSHDNLMATAKQAMEYEAVKKLAELWKSFKSDVTRICRGPNAVTILSAALDGRAGEVDTLLNERVVAANIALHKARSLNGLSNLEFLRAVSPCANDFAEVVALQLSWEEFASLSEQHFNNGEIDFRLAILELEDVAFDSK